MVDPDMRVRPVAKTIAIGKIRTEIVVNLSVYDEWCDHEPNVEDAQETCFQRTIAKLDYVNCPIYYGNGLFVCILSHSNDD